MTDKIKDVQSEEEEKAIQAMWGQFVVTGPDAREFAIYRETILTRHAVEGAERIIGSIRDELRMIRFKVTGDDS